MASDLAGTLTKALIVAGNREIGTEMATLVAEGGVEVVPVTAATRMAEACAAEGRGNHPTSLNFGDCFAYALAQEAECALLYLGQDFARMDVAPVIQEPVLRSL